jgi:UDP-N-acetylmuramate--alanine ligase
MILEKMTLENKQGLDKEEMLQWVKETNPRLLVMAGAGDIDVEVLRVKEIFEF